MRYYVKFFPNGLRSFCTTENFIDFNLLNEQHDIHFVEINKMKYDEMKEANTLTEEQKALPKAELEKICQQKAASVNNLYPLKPEKTPEQSVKIGQYKALKQLEKDTAKIQEDLIQAKIKELAITELQKEGKI